MRSRSTRRGPGRRWLRRRAISQPVNPLVFMLSEAACFLISISIRQPFPGFRFINPVPVSSNQAGEAYRQL